MEHLRQIEIVAPQLLHADLMAALSRIGGLVQGLTSDASQITVDAQIPSDQLSTLEGWLLERSSGHARIVRNRPAGGADA